MATTTTDTTSLVEHPTADTRQELDLNQLAPFSDDTVAAKDALDELPMQLWCQVIGHIDNPRDLSSLTAVCSDLYSLRQQAWVQALGLMLHRTPEAYLRVRADAHVWDARLVNTLMEHSTQRELESTAPPLLLADWMRTRFGRKTLAEYLELEQGGWTGVVEAQVKRVTQGRTALHWASYHGFTILVNCFLALGCAVDTTDIKNKTPLFLACERGHLDTVQTLLDAGASTTVECDTCTGALAQACLAGHIKTVELLLRAGAPVLTDFCYHSPLHCASVMGHADIIALLVHHVRHGCGSVSGSDAATSYTGSCSVGVLGVEVGEGVVGGAAIDLPGNDPATSNTSLGSVGVLDVEAGGGVVGGAAIHLPGNDLATSDAGLCSVGVLDVVVGEGVVEGAAIDLSGDYLEPSEAVSGRADVPGVDVAATCVDIPRVDIPRVDVLGVDVPSADVPTVYTEEHIAGEAGSGSVGVAGVGVPGVTVYAVDAEDHVMAEAGAGSVGVAGVGAPGATVYAVDAEEHVVGESGSGSVGVAGVDVPSATVYAVDAEEHVVGEVGSGSVGVAGVGAPGVTVTAVDAEEHVVGDALDDDDEGDTGTEHCHYIPCQLDADPLMVLGLGSLLCSQLNYSLDKAVRGSYNEAVQLLLDLGAKVYCQGSDPLEWSHCPTILSGDADMLQTLLAAKSLDQEQLGSLLCLACSIGTLGQFAYPGCSDVERLVVIKALLAAGAPMTATARQWGHNNCRDVERLVVIKALLAAGSPVTATAPQWGHNGNFHFTGDTPLHFAIRHGDLETVQLLMDAGAAVHVAGCFVAEDDAHKRFGSTPLELARIYNCSEAILKALAAKA
eukprot:gene9560-12145_t